MLQSIEVILEMEFLRVIFIIVALPTWIRGPDAFSNRNECQLVVLIESRM